MKDKVITGAIALIKSKGSVIGKMRSVRVQESIRRLPVRGIGTIVPSEQAAVEWDGTLTCDFMAIDMKQSGVPGALKRNMPSTTSQVLTGGASFEDQIVLEQEGVQIDIFKKVADVIDEQGNIKPKLEPLAIISGCFIESDSLDISEGSISGKNQSFKYINPAYVP